ncbi:MAG TPA: TVP38/TMEM64 family protein [Nitrospiraceae bacterium]|nr:TVP38/TMEM64 family protein [Nitrospiraceae bacterium]
MITTSLQTSGASKFRHGKLVVALVLMGIAFGAVFFFDPQNVFVMVKANRDRLLEFTEANYGAAAALFIVMYCVGVGFSLPIGAVMTVVGGFLFGAVFATVFVNVGATTGATLAFLVARYLLRDAVEQKFGKWIGPFQEGFSKNAFSYLMTLRLIPLFPFFVVNLVSGLTRVNVGTYIAATALGIIPGSFVYAYAGRQFGSINSLNEIASPNVIMALVLLGLLALVPSFYGRLKRKPA